MESTILAVVRETPDTVTLRVAAPFDYLPGQFVMVGARVAGHEREIKRSYSIASAKAVSEGFAEVTVKEQRPGLFSMHAQSLQAGDPLNLYGPFGHHFLFDPAPAADAGRGPDPVVFIAGGSGISPFRAMLQAAAAARYQGKLTLIYSVKTSIDIIYADELAAFAAQLDLALVITLTRPTAKDTAQWKGAFGRVTGKLLRERLGESIATAQFYLCGPTAMVTDTQLLLETLGVPKEHVKTEKFGPIEG